MKTISIRELHTRTGHYVRHAALEPIALTDRGRTVARLVPIAEPARLTFSQRRLRPGFAAFLKKGVITGLDSAQIISDDRDAR